MMLTDKQLKKKYGRVYSNNPDQYYPTEFMKSLGFTRKKCENCKRNFWSLEDRNVCGDTTCQGPYTFINNSPARKKLSYAGVWESFSKTLKKKGYEPIQRYPVVARWRDDIPFVEASIDDFIPYVVSGTVEPPANPLTVPQFCLRFNDISNVGITGAHNTGFVMIGQHRFETPGDYDPNTYLKHLYDWFHQKIGIPAEEIVFHEDVWAGSGNFGPCIEVFSRGLELANQVYMQYKQTRNGYEELDVKVLDMGMGQERVAWFTQGKPQSYEVVFPTVVKKLKKKTGVNIDEQVMEKFIPHSGALNMDEVEDVDEAWREVAQKVGVSVRELKEKIFPVQAVYSIADHTRSLLLAINDGALPSNTGGGYNLRVIFRRCMDFIKKYGWDLDLGEVCEWHVKDLEKMFEIKNLEEVKKILRVEEKKYEKTRKKIKRILKSIKGKVNVKKAIELYDSHGINPETLVEAGLMSKVPDKFYEKVSERHTRAKRKEKRKRIDTKGIIKTKKLYYDDYKKTSFKARVIKVDGNKVVLDKTVFYPTSGGQMHDKGSLNDKKVKRVFEEDGVVVHVMQKNHGLKKGQEVWGEIDWPRRKQLAQHHTAVHVINGAARQVLGDHVWQAGADKNTERARLDITHYETPSQKELDEIQKLANEVISQGVEVESKVVRKSEAEKEYGFRVYQGGSIPGNELRIIKINDFDTEACAGTHVHNTAQIGPIKITGVKRIQDGVIRLELKAGGALKSYEERMKRLADEVCERLGCKYEEMPEKSKELFKEWKNKRKGKPYEFKKGGGVGGDESRLEHYLEEAAQALKTIPEHLPNTIKRFLKDLED